MLFSSAGMPPAYINRSATFKVDELSLNGMPLGAMIEFDYKVIQENLDSADTLLLLSDGLPELKNPNGESFDYPRLERIFKDVADEAHQTIIDRLGDTGEVWRNDVSQDAVERYIRAFKAIRLLNPKFDEINTISLITRLSKTVVQQYIDLIPQENIIPAG